MLLFHHQVNMLSPLLSMSGVGSDDRPEKPYTHTNKQHALPIVIFGLMISGSFFISAMAAIGNPQLATGPQKC